MSSPLMSLYRTPLVKMFSYHLSLYDLFTCSEDGNMVIAKQEISRAVMSTNEQLHCTLTAAGCVSTYYAYCVHI